MSLHPVLWVLWTAFTLAPASTSAAAESSLLATVPADAYALVHCRDIAALRGRAEGNDWYRLLASSEGEPLMSDLAREFRYQTHSEMDELLAMAEALEGEVVFFDTGTVAGFVTEPPADPGALVELMRAWIPRGDAAAQGTLEHAGATVELVAWPEEIDGWSGRAGHFAAFVVHPRALAIYSGDDSAAVMTAVTEGLTGLDADRRAPLVSSYLTSGGGQGGGIELFVDFTPLVDEAEAALKEAVEGMLPDPSRLLGLEGGTWLHAQADLFPGTRIECQARLHLPPDTLVSRLADTFQPLPHTLPADLPRGTWLLYALNWDLGLFLRSARAAYEEAGREEGLELFDSTVVAAEGMTGVDPAEDVLDQLAGDFALFFVDPASDGRESYSDEMDVFLSLGFHLGLVDGDAFQTAFERLIDVGGMESVFELVDIAGVDAYVAEGEDEFDGGVAFLPRTFTAGLSREVLERGLRALTRAEGASLDGSSMQAAIDENAGACFLWCVEMTPLRVFMLPELEGDLRLPPLEDGQPARDPFDSQLINAVRRTPDGFELRLYTR